MKIQNRLLAAGLAAALLATLLSGVGPFSAEPAAATTTTNLITAANRDALADSIADGFFATGSTFAIVAQDSEEAVHLAGTYAARFSAPIVVSASGSNATAALSELGDLGVTHVVLVSSTASWFSSGFQADLATASIAQDAYHQSSDLFTRWRTAAGDTADEYALARTDNADAILLATAYATSRRAPLVLWEPGTSAALLEDFFEDTDESQLVFFGVDNIPTDQMTDTRIDTLSMVDLADLQRAYVWVASQGQLAGPTSNEIVAAPSDELDELALAGVVAAKTGAIVAPAGASTSLTTASRLNEYLTLWKSGTSTVSLVGTGLVTGDLTAVVAPTTSSHAGHPAFRVTGFTQGTTNYTLTVTAVTGATSYTLYDVMGATLATSSTPSLTFSAVVSGGLVVADGSSGELARTDVHLNFYDQTSSLNGMLTVDASGGTNHIRIMSDIATPRLITRAVNDYFSEFPSYGEPVPIAITCSSDFTDVTADATKEYEYEVLDFTNLDVMACGSYPADPAADDERAVAKVTAPPTEFPWLRPSDEAARTAGVTHLQAVISDAIAEQGGESDEASRGPGDDWPPITTRWIAYIPEAKILFPGFSGDLAKPFAMFGGDNHGTNNPNGSYRFRQDMTYYFGSSHSASYAEAMGTTHLYKCSNPSGGGCTLVASATAPLSDLNNPSLGHGATWASGRITAQAKNPLVSIAPPITTDVSVYLSDRTSWVKGYHDNMPKHEFYTGPLFSEYYKAYESSYLSAAVQLPCLFAPDVPIPGCLVYFNAQI